MRTSSGAQTESRGSASIHSNARAVEGLVFQSGERKKMTKTATSFRFEKKLPRFVSN